MRAGDSPAQSGAKGDPGAVRRYSERTSMAWAGDKWLRQNDIMLIFKAVRIVWAAIRCKK